MANVAYTTIHHTGVGMNKPGECPLTGTELKIVKLLAAGLTYQQIALRLDRSASTVRTHLHSIYSKLGVNNRAHAVLVCAMSNWADLGLGLPGTREERLLAVCAQILGDLAEVIKKGRGTANVTPAQRSYLRAFDDYLRSGAPETDEQRTQMQEQLQLVLEEAATSFAALDPTQRRRQRRPTLKAA